MIQKKRSTDHVFGPYSAAARLSSTMTTQAPSISPHTLCTWDVLQCPPIKIVAASAYGDKIADITGYV